MRTHKLLFILLLLACGRALAAPSCVNGGGAVFKPLWDGYTVQIGPGPGDHAKECRAAVVASDGKVIYETYGADAEVDAATGRDVSNDGNRDVVLDTHTTAGNVYSIVSTGNPPGLVRQFVTASELSFEDRLGDGHVEIVTQDTAFVGFEGLAAEDSPRPMVFLRLKGERVANVSSLYWPEYEMVITREKAQLGKWDIGDFMGTNPTNKTDSEKAAGPSPQENRRMLATKAAILRIVVSYLYAGKGQEAWQSLKEMWPYADRDRVRQAILKTRMSGVLGDINRTTAKPAASP